MTKPEVTDRETCKCMSHSIMEMLTSKMHEKNIIIYKTPKEIAKDICCNTNNECECLLRKCALCIDNRVSFNNFEPEKDVITKSGS